MFKVKRGLVVWILLFVFFFLLAYEAEAEHDPFVKTLKSSRHIAHAMGEFQGYRHTNSLEAFLNNYKNGFRIFEVDLILTSDCQLAARHDWKPYLAVMFEQKLPNEDRGKPLSLKEFKSYKINRNLHPLSLAEIIHLLKYFRDAYIITDTKSSDMSEVKKQFSLITETALDIAPDTLERIVPQIYNEEMLRVVREVYSFNNIIFTTYKTEKKHKEILDFVVREDLRFVAMSEARAANNFIHFLSKAGVYSLVFTINEKEKAEGYFEKGVTAIYTDQLNPKDDKKILRKNAEKY